MSHTYTYTCIRTHTYVPSGLGSFTKVVLLFPRPPLLLIAVTVIVTLGRLLFNPVTL